MSESFYPDERNFDISAVVAMSSGPLNPFVKGRALARYLGVPWERLEMVTGSMELHLMPFVDLVDSASRAAIFRQWELADAAMRRCGSPIEELFLCPVAMWPEFRWLERSDELSPIGSLGAADPVSVYSQYRRGRKRLDFVFRGAGFKICVECDGHNFHERTKEQAARDRSRDRELLLDGWHVLRFTGSEIWSDQGARWRQVQELIRRLGGDIL